MGIPSALYDIDISITGNGHYLIVQTNSSIKSECRMYKNNILKKYVDINESQTRSPSNDEFLKSCYSANDMKL